MYSQQHLSKWLTETMCTPYLLHLCQVYIDKITGVIRVPLFLMLLYFLPQKRCDLAIVAKDSLVRSWQMFHQARKGIIQLCDWDSHL